MNDEETKREQKIVTFSQIHEALEERQRPDRRQQDKGLPESLQQDRRQGDRRTKPNK